MRYTTAQLIARIREVAVSAGINPDVAVVQLKRESAWRTDVIYGPFVGGDGEKGLAQFIPGTWRTWGHGDPYDPDNSLAAWAAYLGSLLRRHNGNYFLALKAYNGSGQAAENYARAVLAAAGKSSGATSSTPPRKPAAAPDRPPDQGDPGDPGDDESNWPLLAAGAALVFVFLFVLGDE